MVCYTRALPWPDIDLPFQGGKPSRTRIGWRIQRSPHLNNAATRRREASLSFEIGRVFDLPTADRCGCSFRFSAFPAAPRERPSKAFHAEARRARRFCASLSLEFGHFVVLPTGDRGACLFSLARSGIVLGNALVLRSCASSLYVPARSCHAYRQDNDRMGLLPAL